MNLIRSALFTVLIPVILSVSNAAVIREAGAIYLEDIVRKPLKVRIGAPTAIYYETNLQRLLGELRANQELELQAISGNLFRVRGKARQGQVAGWIRAEAVSGLPPDFIEKAKAASERFNQVRELIARNEVAMGMTPDEVLESLGKPEKKSSRMDGNGQTENWEYIRYDRVPQSVTNYDRYGRLFVDTVYVKIPAGRLAVIFKNGIVEAIEQSEGSLEGGRVKIVVPPLYFY